MELLYKTKYGGSPAGKPRVYFTCHPDDFEKYFEKICNDIFESQDCAVFYKEDMSMEIPDEDKERHLYNSNLIVIIVSLKLLTEPNAAFDSDFAYAKKRNITVLPIVVEPGLDVLYEQEAKFGKRNYLHLYDKSTVMALSEKNPWLQNDSAIPFEEKLKKYLEDVLVSPELAKRIRAAFDTRIFLSYRNMDREHANRLIRKIHSYPEFRDVGIWYDEYLPLGEDYEVNIQNTLAEYPLFMLMVTPNIVRMKMNDDGTEDDNYVVKYEYPVAKKMVKPIFPVEMLETDKDELADKFLGIGDGVGFDDVTFREKIQVFTGIYEKKEDTAEHLYLMGMAYLNGVDIERDVERGIGLLTSAGENGYEMAMYKLYDMYRNGDMVQLDYRIAVKWAEKYADYYQDKYGEEHPDTLTSLNNLACTYRYLGDSRKALELHEKVYDIQKRTLGEEHPDTLGSLNNLAGTYGVLGDSRKALKLHEKVYDIRKRTLGEEHPDTLNSLNNLASTYGALGDSRKALKLHEKVYDIQKRTLGEEHPDTLSSLQNLAVVYAKMRDYKTAQLYCVTVYRTCLDKYGSKFPLTQKANETLKYLRKMR